jgi:hypothetical protein
MMPRKNAAPAPQPTRRSRRGTAVEFQMVDDIDKLTRDINTGRKRQKSEVNLPDATRPSTTAKVPEPASIQEDIAKETKNEKPPPSVNLPTAGHRTSRTRSLGQSNSTRKSSSLPKPTKTSHTNLVTPPQASGSRNSASFLKKTSPKKSSSSTKSSSPRKSPSRQISPKRQTTPDRSIILREPQAPMKPRSSGHLPNLTVSGSSATSTGSLKPISPIKSGGILKLIKRDMFGSIKRKSVEYDKIPDRLHIGDREVRFGGELAFLNGPLDPSRDLIKPLNPAHKDLLVADLLFEAKMEQTSELDAALDLEKAKESISRVAKRGARYGDPDGRSAHAVIGADRTASDDDLPTPPSLTKLDLLEMLLVNLETSKQKTTSEDLYFVVNAGLDRVLFERYLVALKDCLKAIGSNTELRDGRLGTFVNEDVNDIERRFRSNAPTPSSREHTPNESPPENIENLTPAKALISLEELKDNIREQLVHADGTDPSPWEYLDTEVDEELEFLKLAEGCLRASKRLVTLQLLQADDLSETSSEIKLLEDLVMDNLRPRIVSFLELYDEMKHLYTTRCSRDADDELGSNSGADVNQNSSRPSTVQPSANNAQRKARFADIGTPSLSNSSENKKTRDGLRRPGASLGRYKRPVGDHPEAVFKPAQNPDDYEPGSSPVIPKPAKRRRLGGDHPEAGFKSNQDTGDYDEPGSTKRRKVGGDHPAVVFKISQTTDDYEPGDSPTLSKQSRKRKAGGQHPDAVFKPGYTDDISDPKS